jgi:hypothetical protein
MNAKQANLSFTSPLMNTGKTISIHLSAYSTSCTTGTPNFLKLSGGRLATENITLAAGTFMGKHSGDDSLLTNLPFSSYSTTGTDPNFLKLTGGTLATGDITLTAGTFIGKQSGNGSLLTNLPVSSYSNN